MCYFAQESLLEYSAPATLTAPETSAGVGLIDTKLIRFSGRGLEDVRRDALSAPYGVFAAGSFTAPRRRPNGMGTRCKRVECRAERYAQDQPVVFRLRMSAYPWDSTSALLHPHTSLKDTTTSTATTWAGAARRTSCSYVQGSRTIVRGASRTSSSAPQSTNSFSSRHTLLPFATFKSRPAHLHRQPQSAQLRLRRNGGCFFPSLPRLSHLFLPFLPFASSPLLRLSSAPAHLSFLSHSSLPPLSIAERDCGLSGIHSRTQSRNSALR
ncbi:hypothetical protein B0H14DRAFT_3704927 [Mycena olivaceomarginata]|nr:hypothetical protein B0H14DRAFT_3704927 [Mycena olivaceomarginata]